MCHWCNYHQICDFSAKRTTYLNSTWTFFWKSDVSIRTVMMMAIKSVDCIDKTNDLWHDTGRNLFESKRWVYPVYAVRQTNIYLSPDSVFLVPKSHWIRQVMNRIIKPTFATTLDLIQVNRNLSLSKGSTERVHFIATHFAIVTNLWLKRDGRMRKLLSLA